MSEMHWAFLGLGVALVVGVYWHARRQAAKQAVWNNKRQREGMEEDQLDFFNDQSGGFDEFGVSKARARRAPVVDGEAPAQEPVEPAPADPEQPPASRLFVISVHRSNLQYVPGEELHAALQSCGLEFGQHEIYHRFSPQGDTVFSVASIVKPGFLRPDEADELMTPGISLFLQLPGPVAGASAFDDFLATAQTLAERFDATLLDRSRNPLSIEVIEQMQQDSAVYPAQ